MWPSACSRFCKADMLVRAHWLFRFTNYVRTRSMSSHMSFWIFAGRPVATYEVDLHKELFGHVCVSGGTSLLSGLVNRLTRVATNLTPRSMIVFAPTDRLHGVWTGGSLLASLDSFQDM